jgi:hypothetical protein
MNGQYPLALTHKTARSAKGVVGREPRSMGKKTCPWVLGMWRGMMKQGQRRGARTAGWRLRADESPERAELVPC